MTLYFLKNLHIITIKFLVNKELLQNNHFLPAPQPAPSAADPKADAMAEVVRRVLRGLS